MMFVPWESQEIRGSVVVFDPVEMMYDPSLGEFLSVYFLPDKYVFGTIKGSSTRTGLTFFNSHIYISVLLNSSLFPMRIGLSKIGPSPSFVLT